MTSTSSPPATTRTGRRPRRLTTLLAAGAATALVLASVVGTSASSAAPAAPVAPAKARTAKAAPASLTVRTPYGAVRGRTIDGAQAFLGLPFAKPPVYGLAWRAPVAPKKWKGVRDATAKAPACLQYEPTGIKNGEPSSADCLYLDVYRPSRVPKGATLPVMVFYHGGAGTQGAGRLYGGQTMAERTGTIIVSTNYRLGAAGSLALPSLDAEDASTGGNFALLDQIAALRWVKKSIGAFGGDKKDVTIFGQSAGARAVCNLLAAPGAKNLFDSAIMESSPCLGAGTTQATAEQNSEKYAAAVGCPAGPSQLACLRGAWPAKLVQSFAAARPAAYVGAAVLPQAAGDAIAAGRWHKVPVIVGNTRWEQRLQNAQYANITAEQYAALVTQQFGAAAPQVLAKYPASAYASPFQALAAVRTDAGAGCQVDANAKLFLSQGVPVYRYEFEDPTSPTLFGFQPAGTDMSSAHSVELAYLFDFTLGDRPLTKKQEKLAHSMQDYWTGFAKHGKPKAAGEVTWPRYDTTSDRALRLAPKISVTTGLYAEHSCAFFASLPPA